jgi:hypothetical protein
MAGLGPATHHLAAAMTMKESGHDDEGKAPPQP